MSLGYSLPGNLLTSFDAGFFGSGNAASAIVNHEDLTDVLTILDSFQTPFFSGAPKIRAKDVVHSWPIDALAAPSSAAGPDGVDLLSGDALTPPRRLFNGTQIFRRDVVVSDREREADVAGVRDLYEHQVMKKFKEIPRDFEFTCFRTVSTASATGAESDNTSAGPRMAGFQGTFGGMAIAGSASAGASQFLTADLITNVFGMFVRGAEPDSIWLAPSWKTQFINATYGTGQVGGSVRGIAADDKRIVQNVEVWESPFGQLLQVIVDRFIPMSSLSADNNAYYIGDRSMAKVAFYRPPAHVPLAKTGDNTKGMVRMEATLHIDHPSSWLKYTGITGISGIV